MRQCRNDKKLCSRKNAALLNSKTRYKVLKVGFKKKMSLYSPFSKKYEKRDGFLPLLFNNCSYLR